MMKELEKHEDEKISRETRRFEAKWKDSITFSTAEVVPHKVLRLCSEINLEMTTFESRDQHGIML